MNFALTPTFTAVCDKKCLTENKFKLLALKRKSSSIESMLEAVLLMKH